MGVVGGHEDAVAEHGDSAVGGTGACPQDVRRTWLTVAPDLAAVEGVQGMNRVREGDVHDAVDDDRRRLE